MTTSKGRRLGHHDRHRPRGADHDREVHRRAEEHESDLDEELGAEGRGHPLPHPGEGEDRVAEEAERDGLDMALHGERMH